MSYEGGLSGSAPGGIGGKSTNAWSGGNAPGNIQPVTGAIIRTKTPKPTKPVPIKPPPVDKAIPIHIIPPVLLPESANVPTPRTDSNTPNIAPPVVQVFTSGPSGGGSAGGGGVPVYTPSVQEQPAYAPEGFAVSPMLAVGALAVLYFLTRRK